MKKISFAVVAISAMLFSFTLTNGKLISNKNHIHFYSHTDIEDIKADNFSSVGTIDKLTGDIVFSVPMQSFQFEKALMQKHFNGKDFLDTKQFPKAKLIAKINNLNEVNFTKDGVYPVTLSGDLSIKAKTNQVTEKGIITIKGGVVSVNSKFKIKLADYGIVFEKGKPSSNIAKEVEITVDAEFTDQ